MPQSPNLLFVFTDQQRADTLHPGGRRHLDTPHWTDFAASSCFVEEAYCTQPVCTPSRGSILTGLHPHAPGAINNNIPLDTNARCLSELLPASLCENLEIEYFGKWHLGDEIFASTGSRGLRASRTNTAGGTVRAAPETSTANGTSGCASGVLRPIARETLSRETARSVSPKKSAKRAS
jgi:arylsulfatase A-like enzyme